MTPPPVRVRNLVHAYGPDTVLAIDELDLAPGRVHLAGPNGAGKTTLVSILATLTTPTEGTVEVAGHTLPGAARRARAQLGFAGHEASLHGALTPRQALAMHARLHGTRPRAVDRALDAWGLSPSTGDRVDELSHGQRARLDLARALIHEPRVALLDEPATGLDEAGHRRLSAALDEADPELVLVASPAEPPIETDRRVKLEAGRVREAPA